MTNPTRNLGNQGERLARQYLIAQNYAIIATNWSTRLGEIDIIAQRNETIVFVEVKTRHSRDTESAFAGITPAKQERLLKAIYQFIHDHELEDADWRCDAIGIALDSGRSPVIDHIEDVFDW